MEYTKLNGLHSICLSQCITHRLQFKSRIIAWVSNVGAWLEWRDENLGSRHIDVFRKSVAGVADDGGAVGSKCIVLCRGEIGKQERQTCNIKRT